MKRNKEKKEGMGKWEERTENRGNTGKHKRTKKLNVKKFEKREKKNNHNTTDGALERKVEMEVRKRMKGGGKEEELEKKNKMGEEE